MLNIGCHLSSSKGFLHMGEKALSIGANTFQFFTRNPRGGKAKAIDKEDIAALLKLMGEHNFAPLLAHAPYTLNACSADPRIREFAHMVMQGDLDLMENLPGQCYNFHPGSHVQQGVECGIGMITELLNTIIWQEQRTTILLETMAGKGSEVGRNFQELRAIIDRVELQDKIGVCLDTCHVFDAGYDIVSSLDKVLEEFDHIIGLERLQAIYLNDSLNLLGSNKDRHAKIGEGKIGLKALSAVTNHPVLKKLPFYLETPNELLGYQQEIELLRSLYK